MKKIIKLKEQDIHKIVKRVIKEDNKYTDTPKKAVGNIVKKIYQKRNGEKVIKYFFVGKTPRVPRADGVIGFMPGDNDVRILLCGVTDNLSHLINDPNGLVSVELSGIFNGQPNGPCTSPVELRMKVHIEPEQEEVDDWWNNEITDEMEIKYGDKIGNAIDGHCLSKSNVYHKPSNTCIWWEDSKKFDEWWNSRNN